MSDNVETAPVEGADTPVEAVEPQVDQEAPEQATEAQEQPQEPKKPTEPPWFMKRIDAMNRRNADLARELAALRAQQSELKSGGQLEPTQPERQPETLTEQAIQAEVERRTAQARFNEARQGVIQSGVKEFGAEDWNAKTQMIASLGATDNQAFMEALIDLPDAHRLVASLADDPDRLQALLSKRPAAMAAEMGRMAAAMETTAPKPRISNAPKPVTPISAKSTEAAPDPAKMSMAEFVKWREANAPRKLGGRAKRA